MINYSFSTTGQILEKIEMLDVAGLGNTAVAEVLNSELGKKLQSVVDEYLITWNLYVAANKKLASNHTANNVNREYIHRKKGQALAEEIERLTGLEEREILINIL
mgnify:CR=1 FL=1